MIYVGNFKVTCHRWNWRQDDQIKITPATTNVAINVDCFPPVSKDEADAMTRELTDLVREFCDGQVTYSLLDAVHSENNK